MKQTNQLLVELLEYIEQVEKLNRKPDYQVQSDIFAAYQADIKGLPGIDFNLQSDQDDVWLRIARLKETPAPEPSEKLKAWVKLFKSPEQPPELHNECRIYQNKIEVGIETLEQHPEIQSEFDLFVSTQWEPWAQREKPRRKTIRVYNKLFAVQQTISSDSTDSPIELAWGLGFALWSVPDSSNTIKYPLITQLCEVHLNPTNFDLEIRPRDLDPKLELSCYEDQQNPGIRPLMAFWKSVNENADRNTMDRINLLKSVQNFPGSWGKER